MKKLAVLLTTLVLVCSLSACSAETYDDGYEDGYVDGYSDAEFEMGYLIDEEFFDGYEIGYSDGKRDGRWLEEDAIDYVRDHAEWSPEEAMMVIEAYQNDEPFWRDGSPPSEQDYLDAIESLVYFYEYFYCRHYE